MSSIDRRIAGATIIVAMSIGLLGGASAGVVHRISQHGRVFEPGRLTVAQGDEVVVLNDDAGLLHHVYIDASNFTFDSNELKPGEAAYIQFTRKGRFDVLCAIHPKMRLVVEVQ